jgi:hypothetical protein
MDISKLTFNQIWMALQARLQPPQKIRNWTILKGNWGDVMRVVAVKNDAIEVDTPGAINIQVVPKGDFEAVFQVWKGYIANEVQRRELTSLTRYSKYVISILHWLESEEKE